MNYVFIIGTNDNASACAIRLFRAGFKVVLTGSAKPFDLHHYRNFSPVISVGAKIIDGVQARSYADFIYHEQGLEKSSIQEFIDYTCSNRQIPVLETADVKSAGISRADYVIVCDASLFKQLNISEHPAIISCVAGLTRYKYRITESGQAEYPFLDRQGSDIKNEGLTFLTAGHEGLFVSEKRAGDKVQKDERIAHIDQQGLFAPVDGFIDGVLPSGIIVARGMVVVSISVEEVLNHQELPVLARLISGSLLELLLYDKSLGVD